MSKAVVGCVGLGLMGEGITRRLIETGHTVAGYDIVPAKVAAATKWGVDARASPADVARGADIVLLSVTSTAAVEAAVLGERGIASAGRLEGKVVVDHSTTKIDTTKRIAAALSAATAMSFVDAPVSGGPEAALQGRLAIMAGGETAAIQRIAPVMVQLGRLTHMGAVGAGQATKLVNQTLVLSNYCVIAEALRLAEAYGVDAAKIPAALASGHAGSNLLPVLFERMIARDFTPKGYARQVLKDLEMLHEAAGARHLTMPMAAQALTLFRLLVAQGKSELDGTAILTLYPEPTRQQ
ncbi:MAG TPA: NAD(P)-dependent oxidoreductase [Hyphomicrobiaceae bacterium]|nr:NAD(P)-dependent oxidoreductase [Hyphomicrobiaceae bacterium]